MGNLISSDQMQTPAIFSAGCFLGFVLCYYLTKSLSSGEDSNSSEQVKMFENSDGAGDNYRMILGVRTDLKMQKGKVAAQCAHAAVAAYTASIKKAPDALKKWKRYGQAKITVKIDSEEEMLDLNRKAKQMGILSCIIQDAGHTQVDPGSRTVISFGPAPKSVIDKLTGHLKLY